MLQRNGTTVQEMVSYHFIHGHPIIVEFAFNWFSSESTAGLALHLQVSVQLSSKDSAIKSRLVIVSLRSWKTELHGGDKSKTVVINN